MKVPYSQLSVVVDKLYDSNLELTTESEINDFCEQMAQLIENSGWTIDEYITEMISVGPPKSTNLN